MEDLMFVSSYTRFWLTVATAVVCLVLRGSTFEAQARGGTPQTDKIQAVNSGANPYRVIRDWAHIEGRAWGGSNGVAIDRDGKTVWATDRCSPGPVPGRVGTQVNPGPRSDESGPGEFRTPHAVEFDSKGQLIVADRHNHRIQILTKDGKFIREYDDFGRTSGLAIDKNDIIYTADSESTERVHPGWLRGIRIGSLKDGKVTTFIPAHKTDSPEGAMGEGTAIDAAGNIYTAEATLRGVTKYVRN